MSTERMPLTLMVVHAHPDDEVFGTGGTLARYSAEGVRTVLVTATRGEYGEIVDPTLDETAKQEVAAHLGQVREGELLNSAATLGISEVKFLDFHDSGMMGLPENRNPGTFWMADFDEAVNRLSLIIRQYQPQVIATYNAWGGYGHPDHIQTHRVTHAAFWAAAEPRLYPGHNLPAWQASKLYQTVIPRSMFKGMAEISQRLNIDGPWNNPEFDAAALMGDPDEFVTTRIDVRDYLDAKKSALLAHKTQIAPDNFMLKLPDDVLREGMGFEVFRLAVGTLHPAAANGYEDDLFAGLR